jgi:hypothetical protein
MAIQSVQRNSITPVPPLVQLPNTALGELEKWLPQILDVNYVNRIDTRSDVLVATAVSTPIIILPQSRGLWLVTANIGPVNDAVNYQALAIIFVDGVSARVVQTYNAPNQTITLAGLTISSVQSSGNPQQMNATAIQLTHF